MHAGFIADPILGYDVGFYIFRLRRYNIYKRTGIFQRFFGRGKFHFFKTIFGKNGNAFSFNISWHKKLFRNGKGSKTKPSRILPVH